MLARPGMKLSWALTKHHPEPRTHFLAEKVTKLGKMAKIVYRMSAAAKFLTKMREILSSLIELYLIEE